MISQDPLRLYRRHSKPCEMALDAALDSGKMKPSKGLTRKQFKEQYPDCFCVIQIAGVNQHGQLIERQSTHARTFEAAQPAFIRCNQDQETKAAREPKLWAQARQEWDLEVLESEVKKATRVVYRRALDKVEEYLTHSGLNPETFTFDQIDADFLYKLNAYWGIHRKRPYALATVSLYFRALCAFFNHAALRKWMPENPIPDLKGLPRHQGGGDTALPLDEDGNENWRRVHDAVLPWLANRRRITSPTSGLRAHPESFLALLELMYETGLRISDAIHFRPRRIVLFPEGGEYTCMQIKSKKKKKRPVTVFLEPWLAKKLQALPLLEPEEGFCFMNQKGVGHTDWETYVQNEVRRPLAELGRKLGFEDSLRPHRFRDSFAVNCLNAGADIKDVSLWLGHQSVTLTERYYDKYNRGRKLASGRRFFVAKAKAKAVA